MRTGPPASVLAAFGVGAAQPQRLSGGQGTTWRAGGLILKPLDMSVEALEWQEEGAGRTVVGILHGHPDAPQYLVRAAIFRAVMDHLCNPHRRE